MHKMIKRSNEIHREIGLICLVVVAALSLGSRALPDVSCSQTSLIGQAVENLSLQSA
jgi:hypothetical protein